MKFGGNMFCWTITGVKERQYAPKWLSSMILYWTVEVKLLLYESGVNIAMKCSVDRLRLLLRFFDEIN